MKIADLSVFEIAEVGGGSTLEILGMYGGALLMTAFAMGGFFTARILHDRKYKCRIYFQETWAGYWKSEFRGEDEHGTTMAKILGSAVVGCIVGSVVGKVIDRIVN